MITTEQLPSSCLVFNCKNSIQSVVVWIISFLLFLTKFYLALVGICASCEYLIDIVLTSQDFIKHVGCG